MGLLDSCRGGLALITCDSCKEEIASQPYKLRVFSLRELSRATNAFSTKNLLGKGSHACVYKAVLDNGQVVAVKRPTIGRRTIQDVSSFDTELEVLSKLQNPHLVNLIGYCNEPCEKLLVVEFMGNGTLFDLLHSRTEPLSWPLRVHMAYQAAKALLALHSASPPIIHRDVKSSNILVDKNWNAKLGDLGLALRGQLEDVVQRKTPPAGTMGYIDPAYETPSQLSSKSDVFSFGILLLEIISGRNAIDVRFNPSSIVDWAVPLIRQGKSLALCDPSLQPPEDLKAITQLVDIAACSVRHSSYKRPTMAEVVHGLRHVRRKLPLPVSRPGGKTSRSTTTYAPVNKFESSEDFSDDDMSCDSETLSIFDEVGILGEGNASPTESLTAEKSPGLVRRRVPSGADLSRVMDINMGRTPPSTLASRKPEQPVFDSREPEQPVFGPGVRRPEQPVFDPVARKLEQPVLHPSPTCASSDNSYARRDKLCNLIGLTIPPSSLLHDAETDRNSRATVDSSTLGSKGSLNADPKTSNVLKTITAPKLNSGLKVQVANALQSRLSPKRSPKLTRKDSFTLRDAFNEKVRGTAALQPSVSPQTSPKLRPVLHEKVGGNNALQPPSLSPQTSPPKLRPVRERFSLRDAFNDKVRGEHEATKTHHLGPRAPAEGSRPPPKPSDESGRNARTPLTAVPLGNVDCKVADGSSLQQPVRFRRGVPPIWGSSASAAKFYPSAESPFEKVDLPIAV